MTDYPERWSDVEVVFLDGTVQNYTIKASAGLAPYLAEQAGNTGILSLLCGSKAHAIPVVNIREWSLTELKGKPE